MAQLQSPAIQCRLLCLNRRLRRGPIRMQLRGDLLGSGYQAAKPYLSLLYERQEVDDNSRKTRPAKEKRFVVDDEAFLDLLARVDALNESRSRPATSSRHPQRRRQA